MLRHTLTSLEVLVKDMTSLGILAVLLNNNARATHNLPGVAIPVNLTEARPFTQDLRISHLDEGNSVRGAKRFNEFDILRLRAGLNKHTNVGLTPVQGFCALTQATSKTVMFERLLQNLLIIPTQLRNKFRIKK
jgi:hypothetical protein